MYQDNLINVLDHGFVRLVDHMGSDLSVVRAARVSYAAAWRVGKDSGSDHKLIKHLWKNKHTTPFEACTVTFEVKAPIFVLRQWHRHRTWSYNELSARYKELPTEFYVPNPEIVGTQHSSNKQMRNLEPNYNGQEMYKEHCERCFDIYKNLIENNWPRELARAVLPLATYSHMFATVDLLNLLKFLSLRDHEHAQHEIRVYAQAMKDLIQPIFPVCIEAWESTNEGIK